MRRIRNFNHLHQSKRLVIESIRLQLTKSEEGMHHRRRLQTLPDQHSLQIFRCKRGKRQINTHHCKQKNSGQCEGREYSIPLKLNRWESLEGQQLKKIKLRIQQTKSFNDSQQLAQQDQQKQKLRIGPLIFVKDMLSNGLEKVQKQRRGLNILKFRALNSLNKIKDTKSKDTDDFTLKPIKLSIQLPKIQEKQPQLLQNINKSNTSTPYQSVQIQKAKTKANQRKYNKVKFTDFSPWSTKGQIYNSSEISMK